MKLEQQVCSLEPSKRLRGLGVKQESAFYWIERLTGYFLVSAEELGDCSLQGAVNYCSGDVIGIYSAFTVAELGEMLPEYIADTELFSLCITKRITTKHDKWGCNYYGGIEKAHPFEWITATTEADALREENERLNDELSACTERPGGCGYWREAAKKRSEELSTLKAENERLEQHNLLWDAKFNEWLKMEPGSKERFAVDQRISGQAAEITRLHLELSTTKAKLDNEAKFSSELMQKNAELLAQLEVCRGALNALKIFIPGLIVTRDMSTCKGCGCSVSSGSYTHCEKCAIALRKEALSTTKAENERLKQLIASGPTVNDVLRQEVEYQTSRAERAEAELSTTKAQLEAIRLSVEKAKEDGIASDKYFDAGLRHKSGVKPVDFLNHWLKICRPHAYATQDDSWGELEKLLAIILRNYVNYKVHIKPAIQSLSSTTQPLNSLRRLVEACDQIVEFESIEHSCSFTEALAEVKKEFGL